MKLCESVRICAETCRGFRPEVLGFSASWASLKDGSLHGYGVGVGVQDFAVGPGASGVCEDMAVKVECHGPS